MQGRDFLNHIDFAAGTVDYFGTTYPLLDCDFPTIDPANPAALTADEEKIAAELVRSFAERAPAAFMCNFVRPARFIKCATAICSTTAQCR